MPRITCGFLTFVLLGACQSGHSEDAARRARAEARALHPDYKKPEGYKTECIGRMLFEVPHTIEWALFDPKDRSKGLHFTENIYAMDGTIAYGNNHDADIDVTYAATREDWEIIKRNQQRVTVPYPVPYPDSMAWKDGDALDVYLWRNDRIYRFASRSTYQQFEKNKNALLDIVSRFRPRANHEVPAEPGVCFPHGFIADDGKGRYKVQNTFRLKGTPNVTYTIGTGTNGDDTEPIGLEVLASTLPVLGGLEGAVIGQQVQKRIGPKRIRIGPYHGMAGGFSIHPDPNGPKDQEPAYHMKAGDGGVDGSDIFPYVHVQMDGYPKSADRTLKQPAPPFEDSYARLEKILSSIRLKMLPRPLTGEEKKKIADYVVNPPKDTIDPDEIAFRKLVADIKEQDEKARQAEDDARTVAITAWREISARVDCRTTKLIHLNGNSPLRVDTGVLVESDPVPTILTYGALPPVGMRFGDPALELMKRPLDKDGYLTIPRNLEGRIAKHLCEGYRLWVTYPGRSLQVIVQDSPANGGGAKAAAP